MGISSTNALETLSTFFQNVLHQSLVELIRQISSTIWDLFSKCIDISFGNSFGNAFVINLESSTSSFVEEIIHRESPQETVEQIDRNNRQHAKGDAKDFFLRNI